MEDKMSTYLKAKNYPNRESFEMKQSKFSFSQSININIETSNRNRQQTSENIKNKFL